jgi:hypothetical protein
MDQLGRIESLDGQSEEAMKAVEQHAKAIVANRMICLVSFSPEPSRRQRL